MRKRMGLLVLATTLVMSTIVTTTIASNDKEFEKSIQFRKNVGFTTDVEKVKEIDHNVKNDSKKMFGVQLTDEEVAELNFRTELSKSTKEIKSAAKRNEIIGYAGLFMDQKTGTVNIGLVKSDVETQNKVKALYPHKDRIRFFDANFSIEQLEAKKSLLDQKHDSLQSQGVPLQSWGVSVKDNRVEVELNRKATPEQIKLLNDLVGEEYLKIVYAETALEPFASRSDYTRPLQAGLQITVDKYGPSNSICSSGFAAMDNQGVDGIITAGHCGNVGDPVYQPSISSSYLIGKVTRTTDTSVYADAAWIPTSNFTGVIYGGINVKSSQYGWEDNPGELVIKSGAVSGISAGEISSINKTVSLSNGKTYYSQRQALAYAEPGDSGAPVYESITGGANAVGTLLTGGILSGGQNYFIYSHISQVYSELSVYGVYTR